MTGTIQKLIVDNRLLTGFLLLILLIVLKKRFHLFAALLPQVPIACLLTGRFRLQNSPNHYHFDKGAVFGDGFSTRDKIIFLPYRIACSYKIIVFI